MKKKLGLKFVVIFITTLVIVTTYLVFVFSAGFEIAVNASYIFQIIQRFSLVISIPTSVLFVGIDYLLCRKINKPVLLHTLRVVLYFVIIYAVCISLSGYIIFNSLLKSDIS